MTARTRRHKTTGTEFSGKLAIRQALTNIEEIAPPMAAPMLEIRLGGLSSGCCFPMTVESTAPSSTWLESHGEETVV
ncbi:MAG TPA: hypothetical protein IGP82_11180 [Thermosynechococcus sp. M55_K2018_012]|nr:hypothetical protein [Thermosynechococcus sp. M55_K2018_012]